ncbi:MAG: hypothetical protein IJL69_05470, partial [Oscillospiraceae bacterium]|nr:hypothetical protein [Oscillospiraceae bacterium]
MSRKTKSELKAWAAGEKDLFLDEFRDETGHRTEEPGAQAGRREPAPPPAEAFRAGRGLRAERRLYNVFAPLFG